MNKVLWHKIDSESASIHWGHFNVDGQNVLDLGCGRWNIENYNEFNEFSPIYFKNMGAKKIIGVDHNPTEISFFSEKTNNDTNFIFILQKISSANDIIKLINEYSISAIKCDIEGDEKYFMDLSKEDMQNIVNFAIEFHDTELREHLIKKINEWGFTINLYENIGGETDYMGVIYCSRQ